MSVDGERELEEFLSGALSGKVETPAQPEPETVEEHEVVHDEGPQYRPLPEDGAPVPPSSPLPPPSAETGEVEAEAEAETETEDEGDPNVSWATKKFGDDPANWARAAYEREQHISRLGDEKRRAEQAAFEAINYAREMEAQAQSNMNMGMPMSSAEEAWVDQAMANPVGYAYQAARQGNVQLYNAIIERIAEESPGMAVQIGMQVQSSLREEQAQLQAQAAEHNGSNNLQGDFAAQMGASFQRVGIDVQEYGPKMWEMIETLGDYHPYTTAILGGDQMQRDLAVQAVYDLVRQGRTTTRQVPSDHDAQIQREGELRREAAGVVTGSPHVAPPKEDSFMAGMEAEWRRRGQWYDVDE